MDLGICVSHRCLSVDLPWQDVDPSGTLLVETTIRVSPEPYFRERLPWRMGAVRLNAGPTLNCHLHGEVARGDAVRMALKLDKAGQGVLVALPTEGSEHMQDDPILRAMSCDPKHRRILITNARAPVALPLARALLETGAAHVFVGEAEGWRGWPGRAAFEGHDGLSLVPLDVTDTTSLARLAGEIGGKTDILINSINANFLRNVEQKDEVTTFEDMGPVDDQVLAGHTTSPTTVDWNKDGRPDLLLGAEDGHLYYLENPHGKK